MHRAIDLMSCSCKHDDAQFSHAVTHSLQASIQLSFCGINFLFLFCFVCFVLYCFSVPANDRFANSFLATAAWLVRADVNHNSRPTFPRGLRRRAWTETFADSGRCKSKTSFHRVRRGESLLRPRSFRRWGLWSRILFLSWSCFFLGCYCHCILILVFMLFRVNRKFLFPFFNNLVISSVSAVAR